MVSLWRNSSLRCSEIYKQFILRDSLFVLCQSHPPAETNLAWVRRRYNQASVRMTCSAVLLKQWEKTSRFFCISCKQSILAFFFLLNISNVRFQRQRKVEKIHQNSDPKISAIFQVKEASFFLTCWEMMRRVKMKKSFFPRVFRVLCSTMMNYRTRLHGNRTKLYFYILEEALPQKEKDSLTKGCPLAVLRSFPYDIFPNHIRILMNYA